MSDDAVALFTTTERDWYYRSRRVGNLQGDQYSPALSQIWVQ